MVKATLAIFISTLRSLSWFDDSDLTFIFLAWEWHGNNTNIRMMLRRVWLKLRRKGEKNLPVRGASFRVVWLTWLAVSRSRWWGSWGSSRTRRRWPPRRPSCPGHRSESRSCRSSENPLWNFNSRAKVISNYWFFEFKLVLVKEFA